MLSFFKAIGHFFTSLFGNSGKVVQVVLHDVSSFVNLAGPIVAELAAIAKASPDPSGLLTNIEKWITTYESDATVVQNFINSVKDLPYLDILHKAASLALSTLIPAGTANSLINLAIELAYSIFKKQQL